MRSHHQDVAFRQSYGDGQAQVAAIVGGFDADVVLLSSDADLEYLTRSGLLRHYWRTAPHGGDVCCSPIAIAVRKGNPRHIHDWSDLTQPGLRVVIPDPWGSEAGRMDLCAAFGAALRGHVGFAAGDEGKTRDFLSTLFRNCVEENQDSHSSLQSFEDGTGDVAITPEMEVMRGLMFGHVYEEVIPRSTLRIDTSAAVLDANVDKHETREVAEAFLEYLFSARSQAVLTSYGFRPLDAATSDAGVSAPRVEDLWPIEDLRTWDAVCREFLETERARMSSKLAPEPK